MAWYRRRRTRKLSRYVHPKAKRISEIKRLSQNIQNHTWYISTIFGDKSKYLSSMSKIYEVIYHTDESFKNSKAFAQCMAPIIMEQVDKIKEKEKTRWGSTRLHNAGIPRLVEMGKEWLSDNQKSIVVGTALQGYKNCYSYARKDWAKLCVEFVQKDDTRTLDILRAFYRILSTEDFDILISKTTDGMDNPMVADVLSKTKLFEYLKYSEEDVQNNKKKREKFVKAIAKTPTLIKRIPFTFHMTIEDINCIAPAMRFNFLQFAFKHELMAIRYGWSNSFGQMVVNRAKVYKERAKEDKLVMPDITEEKMREILFSVCLKKHDEFSKWINNYRYYYDSVHSDMPLERNLYK